MPKESRKQTVGIIVSEYCGTGMEWEQSLPGLLFRVAVASYDPAKHESSIGSCYPVVEVSEVTNQTCCCKGSRHDQICHGGCEYKEAKPKQQERAVTVVSTSERCWWRIVPCLDTGPGTSTKTGSILEMAWLRVGSGSEDVRMSWDCPRRPRLGWFCYSLKKQSPQGLSRSHR